MDRTARPWDHRLMENTRRTVTFNLFEFGRLQQALKDNEARREHARTEFLDALTGGQGLGPRTVRLDDCIPALIDLGRPRP